MASVADIEHVASPSGPSASERIDQARHRLLSAEFVGDRDRIAGDRFQRLNTSPVGHGIDNGFARSISERNRR